MEMNSVHKKLLSNAKAPESKHGHQHQEKQQKPGCERHWDFLHPASKATVVPIPGQGLKQRSTALKINHGKGRLDQKGSRMNFRLNMIGNRIEINLIPDLFVLGLVLEDAGPGLIALKEAHRSERSDFGLDSRKIRDKLSCRHPSRIERLNRRKHLPDRFPVPETAGFLVPARITGIRPTLPRDSPEEHHRKNNVQDFHFQFLHLPTL